jgi:hypothetical protein
MGLAVGLPSREVFMSRNRVVQFGSDRVNAKPTGHQGVLFAVVVAGCAAVAGGVGVGASFIAGTGLVGGMLLVLSAVGWTLGFAARAAGQRAVALGVWTGMAAPLVLGMWLGLGALLRPESLVGPTAALLVALIPVAVALGERAPALAALTVASGAVVAGSAVSAEPLLGAPVAAAAMVCALGLAGAARWVPSRMPVFAAILPALVAVAAVGAAGSLWGMLGVVVAGQAAWALGVGRAPEPIAVPPAEQAPEPVEVLQATEIWPRHAPPEPTRPLPALTGTVWVSSSIR